MPEKKRERSKSAIKKMDRKAGMPKTPTSQICLKLT